MKKLSLTALLSGAALFMALGTTTLSAEAMKCGAGKCGGDMKSKEKTSKCGSEHKKASNGKCGGEKKKEAKKEAMKCGQGKCGSN